MSEKLSVNQVHDLLWSARQLFVGKQGVDVPTETTLRAAETALGALAFGLLSASERGADGNDSIVEPATPRAP